MDDELPPFPVSVLADATHWARVFGLEWLRDFPNATPLTPPGWYSEMTEWIDRSNTKDADGRASKAMRKLRRYAPREYEVVYRAMVLGEGFRQIALWLNERAVRNNIPLPAGRDAHYSERDAMALFLSAIEYVRSTY